MKQKFIVGQTVEITKGKYNGTSGILTSIVGEVFPYAFTIELPSGNEIVCLGNELTV